MIIEEFLGIVIPYFVAILEGVGVFIIMLTAGRALWRLIKSGFDINLTGLKIQLARGLALSLEFKLAAEIIKTVVIRTLDEFVVLAAVVVLRVILTFVIHWEMKNSEEMEIPVEKE